jgi:hypothetical protein
MPIRRQSYADGSFASDKFGSDAWVTKSASAVTGRRLLNGGPPGNVERRQGTDALGEANLELSQHEPAFCV